MRKNLYNTPNILKPKWRTISALLLLSNIFLSLCLIFKQEKVIIMPPGLKKAFWIKNNTVDQAYLKRISAYFLHLFFDTTSSNSINNHKILLKYVYPSNYSNLRTYLIKEKEKLKKKNISTLFNSRSIEILKDGKTIKISGSLITFSENKYIAKEEKILFLKILILKGRVFLYSLNIKKEKNSDI